MKPLALAAVAFASAVSCGTLFAQTYPTRPVQVIVPYPPGGVDIPIRLLMPTIQQELGQPWVIEYRPGASGLIGMEAVARAQPDGYTLLATASNPWVVLPAMRTKTPYDPIKDFTPITNTTEGVNVIIASASFPMNNFRDTIEYAKKNPSKLSWATSGLGSFWHLDAENMNRLAGTQVLHVPFQGFGPMIPALYSGQVSMNLITLQTAKPLLDAGKAKVIAVLNSNGKAKNMYPPGAQIVSDILPGFESGASWNGIGGPANLPRPIVMRQVTAIHKALNQKDLNERFNRDGAFTNPNGPEEFAARIVSDLNTSRAIVKAANIPLLE
jgi:tripartite-type tricarboxylate transporter receptor subunit TctC